jgi:crotonobetainyl-CoA:carnitine CoA-transferase CaiB-like acyl-CoA transferase
VSDLDRPPLEGLRVLDLSRYLPGPYATLLLAEMGAEVVKLEPVEGDPARFTPPFEPDGASTLHAFLGRGKRSVVLDLKGDEARRQARALALAGDVVVESFRPGVMARLGLAPDELLAAKASLIVCSISGFGQTGPDRLRAGHDITYLAYAGVLGETGPPGGRPWASGVQPADVGGGALPAVVAILAALLRRERTGLGGHLDVAMTGSIAHWIGPAHRAARQGLTLPPRGRGLLSGGLACYRTYETADGRHLALGALEPHFFANVLQHLGRPELLPLQLDPEAQEHLVAELEAAFRGRPLAGWAELLADDDCCCAPVLSVEEASRHSTAQVRLVAPYATAELRPAPELGEHTAEILAQLSSSSAGSSSSDPIRSRPASA